MLYQPYSPSLCHHDTLWSKFSLAGYTLLLQVKYKTFCAMADYVQHH